MDLQLKRKPRTDSKLDGLPPERFMELRERMLSNQETYQEIRAWLAGECGVAVSGGALSVFFKRHCAPLLSERRQLAAAQAEAVGSIAAENPVDWDAATIERLRQFAFQMMLAPGADPRAVKAIFAILLKKQGLDNDTRKVRLLETKAAQADQAKATVNDNKLSEEEKAARIRQIFRMG
jgi:hypothetical protein